MLHEDEGERDWRNAAPNHKLKGCYVAQRVAMWVQSVVDGTGEDVCDGSRASGAHQPEDCAKVGHCQRHCTRHKQEQRGRHVKLKVLRARTAGNTPTSARYNPMVLWGEHLSVVADPALHSMQGCVNPKTQQTKMKTSIMMSTSALALASSESHQQSVIEKRFMRQSMQQSRVGTP